MHSVKYVHWQDGDWWLGYLEEYPDYWTQGETLQDLVEHLKHHLRQIFPDSGITSAFVNVYHA